MIELNRIYLQTGLNGEHIFHLSYPSACIYIRLNGLSPDSPRGAPHIEMILSTWAVLRVKIHVVETAIAAARPSL